MKPSLRVIDESSPKQPVYQDAGGGLLLHTKSGVYYVRKYYKRHKIPDLFASTRETNLRRARSKAEELMAAHLAQYLGGDPSHPSYRRAGKSFGSAVDEIFLTIMPRKRRRTQGHYRHYLTELKKEWSGWDLSRMTLAAYQTWLTGFKKRKGLTSYADYAKYLNLVYRYAYKQRYVSHLLTFPNPDGPREHSGRVFTRDEIACLWEAMNEDTRDQFVLAYECFMRLREVLYLAWDRVNFIDGVITLRAEDVKTGSKTGRGRSFKISPHALKRLKARRRRDPDSRLVFPSPGNPNAPVNENQAAWRGAKKRARIEGRARWHDIRHTALTHALLDEKLPMLLVSEFAGVSVRTIQQVYLHSTAEKTALVAQALSIPINRRESNVKTKKEDENEA